MEVFHPPYLFRTPRLFGQLEYLPGNLVLHDKIILPWYILNDSTKLLTSSVQHPNLYIPSTTHLVITQGNFYGAGDEDQSQNSRFLWKESKLTHVYRSTNLERIQWIFCHRSEELCWSFQFFWFAAQKVSLKVRLVIWIGM